MQSSAEGHFMVKIGQAAELAHQSLNHGNFFQDAADDALRVAYGMHEADWHSVDGQAATADAQYGHRLDTEHAETYSAKSVSENRAADIADHTLHSSMRLFGGR